MAGPCRNDGGLTVNIELKSLGVGWVKGGGVRRESAVVGIRKRAQCRVHAAVDVVRRKFLIQTN